MSVINKVLKDLDKRRQSIDRTEQESIEQNHNGFIVPQVQYHSATKASSAVRTSYKGLVISIVMIMSMLILGFMLYQQGKQLQRLQPLAENQVSKSQRLENIAFENTLSENIVIADNAPASVSDADNIQVASSATDEMLPASTVKLPITTAVSNNEDVNTTAAVVVDTVTNKLAVSEPEAIPEKPLSAEKTSVKAADVQVRFAQTTRTSSSETQVRKTSDKKYADVKVTDQKPAVTKANEKGHMAVKEVVLTNEELAKKKFDAAEIAEQQQKIDQAIKHYFEALVLQPSLHQARKQLAALYYSVNNLGRAEQILTQGIILFPEEIELVILKAKVENANFSPDKALNTLKGIDDSSEWARDKWILQSDIAQNNGQFELAESAYRSLLTIEPSQARWWMGLAYALDSQQHYSQAADAYRKAMSYRGLSTGAMTYIEQRLIQLGGSQ